MNLKAELSLIFENEQEAKAIDRAISPDNFAVPSFLRVETLRKGRNLLINLRCEKTLETFIATLDDLLACTLVAENTLEAIDESKPE